MDQNKNDSPDTVREFFTGIDNFINGLVGLKPVKAGVKAFDDLAPGNVVNDFTGIPKPEEIANQFHEIVRQNWNMMRSQKLIAGKLPSFPNISGFPKINM